MKRISMFLKERQIRKLKAIARRQQDPFALLVRDAIDFYIETWEKAETQSTRHTAESNEIEREHKGDDE
jgi:hypothetical protein